MKIANQNDFIGAEARLSLSKLSSDQISIISVDDIWDGPLSGSCRWNEEEYYFFTFDQLNDERSGDRWPRKYLLIRTTPKQEEAITKLRRQFSEFKKGLISQEEYGAFVQSSEAHHIARDQIIGWFDSGPNDKNKPSKFMESYFEWKKRNYLH